MAFTKNVSVPNMGILEAKLRIFSERFGTLFKVYTEHKKKHNSDFGRNYNLTSECIFTKFSPHGSLITCCSYHDCLVSSLSSKICLKAGCHNAVPHTKFKEVKI